jgi:hypothetical protein
MSGVRIAASTGSLAGHILSFGTSGVTRFPADQFMFLHDLKWGIRSQNDVVPALKGQADYVLET